MSLNDMVAAGRDEVIKKGKTLRIVVGLVAVALATALWRPAVAAEAGRKDGHEKNRCAVVQALEGVGYRLTVGARGGMALEMGNERYILDSFFSYPDASLGTNALAEEAPQGEAGWTVQVGQRTAHHVRLTAEGAFYQVVRTITLEGHRVFITDALTNRTGEAVGIIVRRRVTTTEQPQEIRLAGVPTDVMTFCAENPTLFVRLPHSRLGVLAEDTISRLQFEASAKPNQAEFSLQHFALPAGGRRTLRWTLYPAPEATDYWAFVNQVRSDWKTNFTLPGPGDFFNVIEHRDLLRDPDKLKAYLQRKHLKIVALAPWLDYENFDSVAGKLIGRAEYKTLMQEARRAFKAADPQIKCLGCMEGDIVSVPENVQRLLFAALPANQRQQVTGASFTDRQMQIIQEVPLRWKDALMVTPDGRYSYELYYRGPQHRPLMAILVHAAPGNGQQKYWLEQARYMLEEVGLDGIYCDSYNLTYPNNRYSYEGWDGVTVDLDPKTGKILRRYTDAAIGVAGAGKMLYDYVHGRNGIMLTNGHCGCAEQQSCHILQFDEGEWDFNFNAIQIGEEPPLAKRIFGHSGQLSCPLLLGSRPDNLGGTEGKRGYALYIMKTVITYLRYGELYFHYDTEIPESGPGSGEYGPINHMFPFTPIGLHAGWVEGQERTITCISGHYLWRHQQKPTVHLFDRTGREIPNEVTLTPEGDGWRVQIRLHDWAEAAVIEQ